MLRQKSRTRLQKLCLPQRAALYRHSRANRVAIALRAPQPDRDRVADLAHRIPQDPDLRRIPALEHDLQPPVVVQIGQREAAAILGKVQPRRSGNLSERPVSVVREHHIPRIAMPCAIGTNQFVDRIPRPLVRRGRRSILRRIRHHLPPEKTG